jgi:hypothetical protein
VPYFSIVMPMFNRRHVVTRAIGSCLDQSFADFEIIVVDDGSTDGSAGVVRQIADPRIRLIAHDRNRGVGPARNTGVAAAGGEWVVMLDSDDELTDGALATIRSRIRKAPADVSVLWFMCRLDDGTLSPDPPPTAALWDYSGFLGFAEDTLDGLDEMLLCVRRPVLLSSPYPDGRMLEDIFVLDLAQRYRAMPCRDVVRLYHQDAGNQIVRQVARTPDPVRDAEFLADRAKGLRLVIERHGAALRRLAPRTHRSILSRLAVLEFLVGHRGAGAATCLRSLAHRPVDPRLWVVLTAGLIGPRVLSAARSLGQAAQRVDRDAPRSAQ